MGFDKKPIPILFSATAEISYPSATPKTNGHPTILHKNRHLALAFAVLQHLLHSLGIEFYIVIDVIGIRRTGAIGVGSALFTENDRLVHGFSLVEWAGG